MPLPLFGVDGYSWVAAYQMVPAVLFASFLTTHRLVKNESEGVMLIPVLPRLVDYLQHRRVEGQAYIHAVQVRDVIDQDLHFQVSQPVSTRWLVKG